MFLKEHSLDDQSRTEGVENIRYYYESYKSRDIDLREFQEKLAFIINKLIWHMDSNVTDSLEEK